MTLHTYLARVALTAIAATAIVPALGSTATPWVEADSLQAINDRKARDFSLTVDDARQQIKQLQPTLTDSYIDSCISAGYIETMTMADGVERVFRKSPRNLALIDPRLRDAARPWTGRGSRASYARRSTAGYIIDHSKGDGTPALSHRVTINFTINVPYNEALAGDTIRAWMPFPLETARQSNIEILEASQPDYYVTSPDAGESVHRTLYMQAPMTRGGGDVTFSYTFSYDAAAQYFSPEYIMAHKKPYNTAGELYRRYTAPEGRHIVDLKELALKIVGDEKDPLRQSELVQDYISRSYPWAGAREYSTIDCIPTYVVEHGYGDCGQVSLLYISLMRSLGVPARWESGWMLHPGEKNYHDWAEVYFEGVGWVPVDTSFGRLTADPDPRVVCFHSTGQDYYRLATNRGVGGVLSPAKQFVRSETVDFQAGEVETSQGNLFYPLWDSTLTIVSIYPNN